MSPEYPSPFVADPNPRPESPRMSSEIARIESLNQHVGQDVTLEGWLYNRRSSGKLEFLQVRDGSGVVQCVASKADLPEDVFARCGTVAQEAAIRVRGSVREDKRAPKIGRAHV